MTTIGEGVFPPAHSVEQIMGHRARSQQKTVTPTGFVPQTIALTPGMIIAESKLLLISMKIQPSPVLITTTTKMAVILTNDATAITAGIRVPNIKHPTGQLVLADLIRSAAEKILSAEKQSVHTLTLIK